MEQDIRERFRRMCEGYFESVSKKLVIEHKVTYLLLLQPLRTNIYSASACKNKIDGTTKHTSAPEKYSKIGSKGTRK